MKVVCRSSHGGDSDAWAPGILHRRNKDGLEGAGDLAGIDVVGLKRFQGWGVFPTTTTNPERPLKELQRLRGWAGLFSHVAREKKALGRPLWGHGSTCCLTYGTLPRMAPVRSIRRDICPRGPAVFPTIPSQQDSPIASG